MDKSDRLDLNPHYVQGQIHATRALVMAVAELCGDLGHFQKAALEHLDRLRDARLAAPVQEAEIVAIDHCVAWVKRLDT